MKKWVVGLIVLGIVGIIASVIGLRGWGDKD